MQKLFINEIWKQLTDSIDEFQIKIKFALENIKKNLKIHDMGNVNKIKSFSLSGNLW